MRIPGLSRIRLAARRLYRRLSPGALVLLYHRVIDLPLDPQWLAVAPEIFDRQMAMLRQRWNVIPLAELVRGVEAGRLPRRRAIAITFDDGYFDNHAHALPILQEHALPATVFVASGFIGQAAEFFWDELERLLLQTPGPGGELRVGDLRIDLPPLAATLAAMPPGGAARWNVLMEPPSARHAAYRDLCPRLAAMPHDQREEVLDQVRAACNATSTGRATHRAMTQSQLVELAQSPLIEIGAHTVTHARLASLPEPDQQREIVGSRQRLQAITGKPVQSFAYPFGNHGDYTHRTVDLIRDAGFACACSNFGGSVRRNADLLQLNRVLVRDWSPEELDRRIRGWFNE